MIRADDGGSAFLRNVGNTVQAVSHRLLSRRPGFAPRLIHGGFVVDKVTLGKVLHRVLQFSPVSIIPPLLHIHSRIICGKDERPVRDPTLRGHSLIPSQVSQANCTQQVGNWGPQMLLSSRTGCFAVDSNMKTHFLLMFCTMRSMSLAR
jgi:hypothetical protein